MNERCWCGDVLRHAYESWTCAGCARACCPSCADHDGRQATCARCGQPDGRRAGAAAA
jgi:hypothetical protein